MKPIVLENGYVRLVPDKGKVMEYAADGRPYSDVVCKENEVKDYREVTK